MAKPIQAMVKLQCNAGNATPAPPVGPALGQHGINIMEFCKQFNARTQHQAGLVIPVVITVYNDRSFTFITKTPPAAILLKRAAGLAKGSGVPNRTKVGTVTLAQVREIAELKAPDLNSASVEAAERMVMGTARSMGIDIANRNGREPNGSPGQGRCGTVVEGQDAPRDLRDRAGSGLQGPGREHQRLLRDT